MDKKDIKNKTAPKKAKGARKEGLQFSLEEENAHTRFTYDDPKDLDPASYNPRAISEYSFQGLCESLKKFGFVDPAIVNDRTGHLVGGHQRVKAALAIGLQEVPVVHIDVSPAEEKALNVTLNNVALSGEYTDTLESLLSEIKEELDEDFLDGLHLDDALAQVLKDTDSWFDDLPPDTDEEPDKDNSFAIRIKGDSTRTSKKEIEDAVRAMIKEHGFEVELS